MKIHHTSRRRGFTLVELLVVIAIIAVLVALGTGGMMKFRKSADKVGAIANIKNLQVANATWASENGGKYIPIFTFDSKSNSTSEWYKTKDFLIMLTGDQSIDEDYWELPEHSENRS